MVERGSVDDLVDLVRIPLDLGTRSDDLGTCSGTPGRSEIGSEATTA
jgi:hypothetical protein